MATSPVNGQKCQLYETASMTTKMVNTLKQGEPLHAKPGDASGALYGSRFEPAPDHGPWAFKLMPVMQLPGDSKVLPNPQREVELYTPHEDPNTFDQSPVGTGLVDFWSCPSDQ